MSNVLNAILILFVIIFFVIVFIIGYKVHNHALQASNTSKKQREKEQSQ